MHYVSLLSVAALCKYDLVPQDILCCSKMSVKQLTENKLQLYPALWEPQILYLCNIAGCDVRADLSSLPNPVNVSSTVHVRLPHHILRLHKSTMLLHQFTNPKKHSKNLS